MGPKKDGLKTGNKVNQGKKKKSIDYVRARGGVQGATVEKTTMKKKQGQGAKQGGLGRIRIGDCWEKET